MRKAVTKETTTAIRPHPTAYWAIGQNLFKTFLKPVKTLVYLAKGRGKKNRLFLGKSPKLWVGGGQES